MKNLILTTIALITLLASQITMAQDNWGLELRNGASFATKELGDATLKTGFGFEGTINYRFMPHLSAYAGYGVGIDFQQIIHLLELIWILKKQVILLVSNLFIL